MPEPRVSSVDGKAPRAGIADTVYLTSSLPAAPSRRARPRGRPPLYRRTLTVPAYEYAGRATSH